MSAIKRPRASPATHRNHGSSPGTPKSPGKGKHFSDRETNMVNSVRSYLEILQCNITAFAAQNKIIENVPLFSSISRETARACGISESSVFRCGKRKTDSENPQSGRPGRKKIECDTFTQAVIRETCHRFYAKREYPTIAKLHETCLQDEKFPRVSKSVFHKWMIKSNFRYKKIFKKPVFLERRDIVSQREYYLRHVRHYRTKGYTIHFGDETWNSPNQARNRCWQILLDKTQIQDFKRNWGNKVLQDVNGLTGGFMVKGGAGRIIINHIGSNSGFLPGAKDVFQSKKDTSDYHNAMNGEHYKHWFSNVLKLVPNKSVIILDQASYHKMKVPGTTMPTMSWVRPKIIEWMHQQAIPLPQHVTTFESMTKASLITLSRKYPVEQRLVLQDLVDNCGKDVKLLFLPVAHCELNPIELIWAYVKGKVSELNTVGGPKNVLELTNRVLDSVTPELWQGCIREAIRYEERFWERDRLIEQNLDIPIVSDPKLCFRPNDQSDTSESESESDMDSSSDIDWN